MIARFLRNIIANWAGGLAAALIAFFLTPYVIGALKDPEFGNQPYGVWTFVVTFTAYFGLVDLGFFQSTLQFFTRYRATNEVREYNRVVSTSAAFLTFGCLVAILVAAGLAWFFPSWVDAGGVPDWQLRLIFFLSACGVALHVPLEIFRAIIVGCESFHVMNLIVVSKRLGAAAAIVWALAAGHGLLGLAIATVSVNLIGDLVQAGVAFRLEPALKVRRQLVSTKTARELIAYGKWMFGIRITDLYLGNVDLLLVPFLFGAEATAVYGLAFTFVRFAQLPVQGFSQVFTPSAIGADAAKKTWQLEMILLRASRVGLILSGTIVIGFFFWGEDFMFQWLGDPSFLWDAEHASAATVLVIVALDRVFLQGLAGSQQVLIGMRRAKELSLLKIGQGLGGLVTAFVCGKYFGLLAIPLALLAVSIVTRSLMTVLACRLIRLPLAALVTQTLFRTAAVLALLALACAWIHGARPLEGWAGLSIEAALAVLTAAIAGLLFGLRSDERRDLVHAFRALLR